MAYPLQHSLEDVLGPTAPARDLTASKTAMIIDRDGSQITGFVLTQPSGGVGIVDKSAVRWLTKDDLWWLMHVSESPLQDPKCERCGMEMKYHSETCTTGGQRTEDRGQKGCHLPYDLTLEVRALHRQRVASQQALWALAWLVLAGSVAWVVFGN